jgi:hypothetical protein
MERLLPKDRIRHWKSPLLALFQNTDLNDQWLSPTIKPHCFFILP